MKSSQTAFKLPDMTPDLMAFQFYVSLAQAQECILQKSLTDHRKSIIVGKFKINMYLVAYNIFHLTIVSL